MNTSDNSLPLFSSINLLFQPYALSIRNSRGMNISNSANKKTAQYSEKVMAKRR